MTTWTLEIVLVGLGLLYHGNDQGPIQYVVPAAAEMKRCGVNETHATTVAFAVDDIESVSPAYPLPTVYAGGRGTVVWPVCAGTVAEIVIADELAKLATPASPREGVSVNYLAPIAKVVDPSATLKAGLLTTAPDKALVDSRVDIRWVYDKDAATRPSLTARKVGRLRDQPDELVSWKVRSTHSQSLAAEGVFRAEVEESATLKVTDCAGQAVTIVLSPPIGRVDRAVRVEVATLPTSWTKPSVYQPTQLHHLMPVYSFFNELDCTSTAAIETAQQSDGIDFVGAGGGTFCLNPHYP